MLAAADAPPVPIPDNQEGQRENQKKRAKDVLTRHLHLFAPHFCLRPNPDFYQNLSLYAIDDEV
jgi:hypothetical protein